MVTNKGKKIFNRTIADIELRIPDEDLQVLVDKSEKDFVAIYEHENGDLIALEDNSLEELVEAMFEYEENEDSFLQGVYINGEYKKINYKKVIIFSLED